MHSESGNDKRQFICFFYDTVMKHLYVFPLKAKVNLKDCLLIFTESKKSDKGQANTASTIKTLVWTYIGGNMTEETHHKPQLVATS